MNLFKKTPFLKQTLIKVDFSEKIRKERKKIWHNGKERPLRISFL
jgi:hypothetical protein